MNIYNVYQSGKRLYIDEKENPDNKIACNKYESEQTTLRLISDGTLPPRLYWALRNPKLSQKYFILKLVNNEDLIVGTDISATPGLWDMLLIGTDEDYIIEGADIDQSRLTYVSDHFGRLFVRDNFLEELDFEEQCSPTFKVFYDEIMFQLDNIPDLGDIPDKMSDLENDTNFISGVAFKDDGEGNVNIIGTTFSGGETEEGGGGSGCNIEVDDKLDEKSINPVQNKVVAKEIKTLKDKDKSLDKEVIALRERNAKLEETIEKLQIKTTTSPSPFHHITDSANMKVLDFGMEGKTEQRTTSGKNLYSGGDVSGTGIVTVQLNERLPAGTYTFSAKVNSSDTNSNVSNVSFRDDNMNEVATFNLSRNTRASANFTLNTDIGTVRLYAGQNSGDSTNDTFSFTDIQLELGSVATDYEPYTGNQPSPNPDYPQEIVNAGVYNEETGRYEIGCRVGNKNLWNAEYASDVSNWIPSTNQQSYSDIPIYVGKGNVVTISYKNALSLGISGLFSGIVLIKDDSIIKWIYHPTVSELINRVYTCTAKEDYIYIRCIQNALNNGLFMQYIGNDLQIEIADAPTDLVPHQSQQITLTSPVPLTKWDYLTKRDGVWGWSIWSVIHTISEDEYTRKYDNFTAKFSFYFGVNSHLQSMIKDRYCNIAATSPWGDTVGTFSINNGYLFINFQEEEMTKEECLAKIKESPIVICCKTIEEQAFHPLPDEEQTLLNNLETYYGVTNVYNDQGCPITLTYVSDPELHWNQKLEQINSALLSLGANI